VGRGIRAPSSGRSLRISRYLSALERLESHGAKSMLQAAWKVNEPSTSPTNLSSASKPLSSPSWGCRGRAEPLCSRMGPSWSPRFEQTYRRASCFAWPSVQLLNSFETLCFDAPRTRVTGVRTCCSTTPAVPRPRPIWLVAEKYQLASGVPVEDFPRLLPEDYYYPRIRRVDHPVHHLREQTRTQNVLLSTNADQSAATADVAARVSVGHP
jgi:hypothetical protein